MENRIEKISDEVSKCYRLVDDLLNGESISAVSAFIIGGKISTSAALLLNATPEEFSKAMDELSSDYETLFVKLKEIRKE